MGTISKVKLNGTEHLIASTAYATCTTAAATAAKVATVQNNHAFSLVEGETIHVYFKYSNTASSPTLNINDTGAKPIRQHGSTAPSGWGSAWRDQSIISFTYNTDLISTGCWLINDFSYQSALTVDFDYQYAYSEGFDTDAGTVEDAIIDVYNQTKNVNPNWSASAGVSSILNKPAIPSTAADVNAAPSYHTHSADEIQYTGRISAVSGNDLTDIVSNIYDQLEVMPAAQINSDWTATAGVSSILNKPAIPSTYSDIGAMSASGVSIDRKVSTGTNIADITINGATTSLYAPTGGSGGVTPLYIYVDDDTDYTEVAAALSADRPVYAIWSSPTEDTDQTIILKLIRYNPVDYEYYFSAIYGGYSTQNLYWACLDTGGWEDAFVVAIPKGQRTFYGTSSTTASTAEKAVTIQGFTSADFVSGVIVGILFTTANTAATPTLNINSIGVGAIYMGASALDGTTNVLKWSANTMIYFMYDGSRFRYMYASAAATVTQPRGANTWYGTSSTLSITQAKTSTVENFVLTKGALIVINFSTANAYNGKITLNINSTGAKDVYYKNAVTSSTNKPLWKANSTVTFVYSGSYYYIVNITPSPDDEIYDSGQVEFNTQDQNLREVIGVDPTDLSDTTDIGSALESVWYDTKYCYAQARGTASAITAAESGVITQVALSTIEKSYGGSFSISDGGIKVPLSGTYRISGSVYGRAHSVNESNATASGIYNANFGCYLKAGTSFATSSEILGNWWPHCGACGHGVGPIMYDLNANDIVYLTFRSRTAACNVSPTDKATYLLVEKMP